MFIFLCPSSATPLLQSDIAALYIKVGVKNIGTVFLHTDAQIPDERFLVLINDMLASGVATLTKSLFAVYSSSSCWIQASVLEPWNHRPNENL